MEERFRITSKDILQANAAVITGILILLTIGSTQEDQIIWEDDDPSKNLTLNQMVALTIMPLSFSIIIIAIHNIWKPKKDSVDRMMFFYAIIMMILGFAYLVLMVVLISGIHVTFFENFRTQWGF